MGRRVSISILGAAIVLSLLVTPASAAPSRLTTHAAFDLGPRYSPQGTKIAFLSDRPVGQVSAGGQHVWVMDADGSNKTNISCPGGDCDWALQAVRPLIWAPDGSHVLYQDQSSGEIYRANVDGSGVTNVSNTPNSAEYHPVYSPDGTKIYFGRGAACGRDFCPDKISVMNANGSGREDIAEGYNFDVSSKGARIAYACLGGCSGGIHIVNTNGTGQFQLTNSPHDNFPIFSPDGDQVIFSREFPATLTADLFRVNIDGTGLTRLTNDGRHNGGGFMDWSDNGQKIAYEWSTAGESEFGVAVINTSDGSSRQDMGSTGSEEGDPSFALGSGRLAYFSDEDERGNIDVYTETVYTATATAAPLSSVGTDDGEGASESDPTTTRVFTHTGGDVSIQETSEITEEAPSGYQFIGEQVNIEAPSSTEITPLGVTFRLDASLIPAGENERTIQVFRNGVLVQECSGVPEVASPDPCLSQRTLLSDGDVQLEVLTSHASAWNFGVSTAPAYLAGHMTGAGTLSDEDGGRVTHNFDLKCDKTRGPNRLEVNAASGRFSLAALTEAVCRNDASVGRSSPGAGFDSYSGRGSGVLNGLPATAEWFFVDAGEPGRNDFGRIVIRDARGDVVVSASGNLISGNYQAKG